ncbi:MAG TPA: VOC family protein [Hyphomicrobiales bacterium]|nr:VOC family protein [Hyphomicrobiales bacterium]
MASINRIACITIAVKDQDEALRWFTEKLGFEKRADQPGPNLRWLSVSPPKQPDLQVVLASWFPELIGKNATPVLHTDDCRKAHEELKARGIDFTQTPQEKPYGLEAVFKDLYGNRYALVEPRASRD